MQNGTRKHTHIRGQHIVGKSRQTTYKKNKQPRKEGRRAPRTSSEPWEIEISKRENTGENEERDIMKYNKESKRQTTD